MSSSAALKNYIAGWSIGIYADTGGVVSNGSKQIFANNTTDYSPTGKPDPAYIS